MRTRSLSYETATVYSWCSCCEMTEASLLPIDLQGTCLIGSQMEQPSSAELYCTTHLANSSYSSTHLGESSFCSWSLDRSRSWAQVVACGCLFLFSASHPAKGSEEQMDNLCTEVQAEILS